MSQPEVTIEQGTLRGSLGKDISGNSFYKFQGIPYAKPPLGKLRFKAPQPPEKWTGIWDATEEGDVSYAKDPLKEGKIFGSENCLFLNVFTKNISQDNNLAPVLFWIHGGGFTFGSGKEELYGPEFLLTENVVLVTINYRLGLLGFASFDDPILDIPGNAGLKDQVMALKWVQKNISSFGGDPKNVTIFGESAGGASVHLLMLSPMGKGLFHKAIAHSGCVLNPWADGQNSAKILAKVMGLDGSNEKAIYDALMSKSVDQIYEIQEKMGDDGVPCERRPIGFVVEKNAKEPFLDKEPLKIMRSGQFNQVPFIIGFTSSEGMISELHKQTEFSSLHNVIPWSFGCTPGTPETEALANKIKKFYFGNEESPEKSLSKKYDMFSDTQFLYGIFVTILSHLSHPKAPIYLYQMSVETDLNILKKFLKIEVPGVCHCDDIGYLFKGSATPEIKSGSLEEISVKRFVRLWTNFAKFGNPTPDNNDPVLKATWKPVKDLKFDYLDIGKDLVCLSNPTPERFKFWQNFFTESPAGRKN